MPLDPTALELYVYLPHRDLVVRDAVPCRADPPGVGRFAEQYVGRRAHLYDGETSSVIVARCAGILIYAMDGYGLTFEEICGLASPEVANLLAQVTPDNRMTEPTRHLKLREALGLASEVAQLIKLAEIAAFAHKVLTDLTPGEYLRHGQQLKHIIERHGQLLQAMPRLVGHKSLMALIDAARDSLTKVSHGIDDARAARSAVRSDVART
jgi:hypothetical protein